MAQISYGPQEAIQETIIEKLGLGTDNKVIFPESKEVSLSQFIDLGEENGITFNVETGVKYYTGTFALTQVQETRVQNLCNEMKAIFSQQNQVGALVEKVTLVRIRK